MDATATKATEGDRTLDLAFTKRLLAQEVVFLYVGVRQFQTRTCGGFYMSSRLHFQIDICS